VLALYSAPGFDPNAFVGGISAQYWRALSENPAHPLLDRAIQARYPPGSTWKLAVAAMALKRGIVGPRTRMPIPCRGGLQYGNRFFRCWNAHGHGDLDAHRAIAQSCRRLLLPARHQTRVTSLLEDANQWGFRGRTGIDLPGESASEFPTGPEYYDRLYGARRWTSAVALNLAIGQGENARRSCRWCGYTSSSRVTDACARRSSCGRRRRPGRRMCRSISMRISWRRCGAP